MYAIEAKVNTINMSFNAFSTEENAVLKDAVKKATEAGIIVVSSAGNNNLDAKYFTPSNIDDAIVIGSAVEADPVEKRAHGRGAGGGADAGILCLGADREAIRRQFGFRGTVEHVQHDLFGGHDPAVPLSDFIVGLRF